MTATGAAAPELIRSIGLLADGPVRWSRPVAARGPGVYLVELPTPLPAAPLELSRVGKWLERVPGLRLDGERPTSRALAARLASLWWPESPVLFAGATPAALARRVAGLVAHVPGERQPHPEGQWLHLLRDGLEVRIWWAETDAPEEYLDALLDAFAEAAGEPAPERPPAALALPWATTRRPTGERQAHGIAGAVLPGPPRSPEPPRRVVAVAPGDAEGAREEERGTGTTRRVPRPDGGPTRSAPGPRATQPRTTQPRTKLGQASPSAPPAAPPAPVELSPEAMARLRAELDELTRVRRPEVVARIKAARELGDLRENAEYQAAREEQSFLEGRVQALEDRLRRAVIVTDQADGRVGLGSVVTVETGGQETTFTIVGSTEANPAEGRLSAASPVGAALLGRHPGEEVDVRTPRGPVRYRVVSLG